MNPARTGEYSSGILQTVRALHMHARKCAQGSHEGVIDHIRTYVRARMGTHGQAHGPNARQTAVLRPAQCHRHAPRTTQFYVRKPSARASGAQALGWMARSIAPPAPIVFNAMPCTYTRACVRASMLSLAMSMLSCSLVHWRSSDITVINCNRLFRHVCVLRAVTFI